MDSIFHGPELSHMVTANCKEVWEIWSSYVSRKKRMGLVGNWLVSNIQMDGVKQKAAISSSSF